MKMWNIPFSAIFWKLNFFAFHLQVYHSPGVIFVSDVRVTLYFYHVDPRLVCDFWKDFPITANTVFQIFLCSRVRLAYNFPFLQFSHQVLDEMMIRQVG